MPARRFLVSPQGAKLLQITSTSLPVGEVTAPYNFTFSAANGTPPYTWSETGSLPAGMTLSSGGVLSGTPTGTFSGSFNVTVTDSLTPVHSHFTASFSLTIVAAVSITTTSPLPNATQSSPYSTTMAATGGVTPYVWSLLSNTGTNTWAVSGTGVVTGTPANVETDTLDIQVVDALSVPSAANFNLTVSSASGTTFDFYVSPTGADTNLGTVASPWAITSLTGFAKNANNVANWNATTGKRVGFLPSASTFPGTYDISSLMDPGSSSEAQGALQLKGGTAGNISYWGSSDASGHYSPRTATLDAKGASGLFGGCHSTGPGVGRGPMISHCGVGVSYNVGFATIDGLRFIGGSFMGVRLGGGSSADGPTITNPVLVTNCEYTGFGFNAGDTSDNVNQAWLDHNTNAITYSNNWHHDNVGPTAGSGDHFNAIQVWGFSPSNLCTGTVVQFNTCVNSGNIYGKEGGIQGSIVQNNYLDMSMFVLGPGFQDFTGLGQGISKTLLTVQTVVQNNIAIQKSGGVQALEAMCGASTTTGFGADGWMTPVIVRNNTVITAAGSSAGATVTVSQAEATSHGIGAVQCYNNLYVNNGISGSLNGVGNWRANPAALSLMDYNMSPSSGVTWVVSNNATLSSGTNFTTPATFGAAIASGGGISGVAAHDVLGTPTFVGTGLYAAQYQLTAGSVGHNAGSTTGLSSGSPTDMGAWGGATPPTQIGCSFAT